MTNIQGQHNFNRDLVCIEYPGVVKNVDKMLDTLGGLNTISSIVSQKKRRLELRFRTDDVFSKPACGDRISTSALLLRIKVRRKVAPTLPRSECNVDEENSDGECAGEVVSCETTVVGKITTVYKFSSMCDFQYLPLITDSVGKSRCIYEDVVPYGVKDYSWIMDPDAPLFILPPSFSRMDAPQNYSFRRGKEDAETPANTQSKSSKSGSVFPKTVIGRTRTRRSLHTIFMSWHKLWAARQQANNAAAATGEENAEGSSLEPSCSSSMTSACDIIPTKPQETAVRLLRIKFLCGEPFIRLQKFLEERPVTSKNALIAITKLTQDQLKFLLPSVAYYFINGPWRGTWARFGYDPSANPAARQYQTLDFRLRRTGGVKSKIKAKRSSVNCSQPYKFANCSRPKIPILKKMAMIGGNEDNIEEMSTIDKESMYIYRPGLVPPSMQMFYQYCDLQLPEIQEMLENLPKSGPDLVCTEQNGWLPPGFDDKCRDLINHNVALYFLERSSRNE
ncbi:general transcription factor 3C polypeptide 5 [Ischnura elegans]|uniref:general transcription factor 3C polypeptide 5 n=1 Tax=Ischnura elegans TaxID=197161 RepID=UPI001ED87C79|nr:general transcription factor 3C polypeptide 5 [Ischnura elegans]